MLTVKIGDLFESNAKTLVNTINCVGVMGKGIAQEFKKRYPEMFTDYVRRCQSGEVKLGAPYLYERKPDIKIINFPTKQHWRSPAHLQDIIDGLDYFIKNYQNWQITSIAFPPLGCGNGGLAWETVGPIMMQKLKPLDIDIEIYAPYGTKKQFLSEKFLATNYNQASNIVGKSYSRFNTNWIAIVEVIMQLEQSPFTNPVGRTIFQKICYILTELGISTGFHFKQGSYGPFSDDIQSAISVLSNANLIKEEQLGKMTAIKSGSEYLQVRPKHAAELTKFKAKIDKTVDLFRRIKSTDQAEETATVLFTIRQLKSENQEVSEQDVLNHVLKWKKSWSKDPNKQESVAETIRGLQMLDWTRLKFSPELPYRDDPF